MPLWHLVAVPAGKKLKVYCMLPHLLQPHILVCGTNVGVVVSCFDSLAAPPAAPLPTLKDSASHTVPFCSARGLQLLRFQLLSVLAQGPEQGGGESGGAAVGEPDRPVVPAGPIRMDALEAAVPKVGGRGGEGRRGEERGGQGRGREEGGGRRHGQSGNALLSIFLYWFVYLAVFGNVLIGATVRNGWQCCEAVGCVILGSDAGIGQPVSPGKSTSSGLIM